MATGDKTSADQEAKITQLNEANGVLQTESKGLASQLEGLRAENTRLENAAQAAARERDARMASLQQENAILGARLRQAQGTLDQIANVARLINNGEGTSTFAATAPRAPAPTAAAPRVHIVQDGDSLTRISLRYYGTTSRWQEIYAANRDLLQGENALIPGQRLRIP